MSERRQREEAVHYGENCGVSIRKRETHNKIHCNMRPGTTGNRKGFEKASRRTMRCLTPANTEQATRSSLISLDRLGFQKCWAKKLKHPLDSRLLWTNGPTVAPETRPHPAQTGGLVDLCQGQGELVEPHE